MARSAVARSVESWVDMFTSMNDLERAGFLINDLIGYRVNANMATRTDDVESVSNALKAMQHIAANAVDAQITTEAMDLFKLRVQANMTLARIELANKGVDLEDMMRAIQNKDHKAFNELMTIFNAKGDAP